MSLLILADDLTGTADTAARCFQAGMPASIFLHPPRSFSDDGAVALTSDSRHLPPAQAARALQQLLSQSDMPADATIYKKIDSTLRGNIGAELAAVLETLSLDCALICPAFPAQDRGLRDGYLVHADTPAGSVYLPSILAAQTDLRIGCLALSDVRSGPAHLASRMRVELFSGTRLLIGDALTEVDLECLLAATRLAAPAALLCGSAGLAGVLARGMAVESEEERPGRQDAIVACDRALVVVGSGSAMARRQIDALASEPDVADVELTADLSREGLFDTIGGCHCLLHLPAPAPGSRLDGPKARELAAMLAQAAVQAMARLRPDALVLVGGDTALHVLQALKVEKMAVRRELAPGIPLLQSAAGSGELPVVLKAGNHGNEATLVEIVRKLAGSLPM
jgi:4-hydroxythreonine-4-phosphate dehydrogenase